MKHSTAPTGIARGSTSKFFNNPAAKSLATSPLIATDATVGVVDVDANNAIESVALNNAQTG